MRATSFKALVVAAIAGGFLLLVMGASASTASWTVRSIGGPGFTPMDINNGGTVVGYVGSSPSQQPVVVRNGVATVLPTPDNVVQAVADAINNAGTIVGTANLDDYSQEAVMWDSGGHMTFLGFLSGGTFSSAHGINDRGQVVGIASPGYQAVVWDKGPGSIKALPTLPDLPPFYFASAEAINDGGRIVGSIAGKPILWNNETSVPTVLPSLVDGATAGASAINNAGQIVGWGNTATVGIAPHAVLWRAGKVQDLNVGGGTPRSWANGINEQGTIVGASQQDFASPSQAVVIQGSVITSLAPLAGDSTTWATAIDNAGRVVGYSGAWPNSQGVTWTR